MKKLIILFVAAIALQSVSAQKVVTVNTSADEIVHLWNNSTAKYSNNMEKDELIKGRSKVYNTSSTELYIFTPEKEKSTGYTVVIYPGGGYRYLSFPITFPEWLRENGITAVVVKYRLPNYGHSDAMLEDAIGAIDYMRNNAEKYNIDPQKIGVCGNSAGGHLAAWVSNIMEDGSKPHFTILIYGAMTRNEYHNSYNANKIMFGHNVTPAQVDTASTQDLVGPTTPPAIMFLSDDDTTVLPVASTSYYKALKRYGIPASMHIYPSGGHGWSGRMKWEYRQQWLSALKDWFLILQENDKNR